MKAAATTEEVRGPSPMLAARMAGVFSLLTILMGIFAEGFVSNRLVAWGDAAATANHILSHRNLFQWGFTVYLVEMACDIVTTALFYVLLAPVNRTLALVATLLGLVAGTIKAAGRVFFIAPLFVLGGQPYLDVFSPEQLRALALLFLTINDHAAGMALAFYGFNTVLIGYLMFRSTFLPRILGAWSLLAGLGWLTFLSPPLGYRLFPYVAAVGVLGAVATIVWLLAFGVNEGRWHERAGSAGRAHL